jgi:hypothetical protein
MMKYDSLYAVHVEWCMVGSGSEAPCWYARVPASRFWRNWVKLVEFEA